MVLLIDSRATTPLDHVAVHSNRSTPGLERRPPLPVERTKPVLRAQATLHRETRKLQQAFRTAFPSTSWRISREAFVGIVVGALNDEDLGGIPREAFQTAAERIFDEKLATPLPPSTGLSPRGVGELGHPAGSRGSTPIATTHALGVKSVAVREAISFFRLGQAEAAGVPSANTAVLPTSLQSVLPTLSRSDHLILRKVASVYGESGMPSVRLSTPHGRLLASRMRTMRSVSVSVLLEVRM